MRKYLLLFFFITSSLSFGQDVIVLDGSGKYLNHSIADHFAIYRSPKAIVPSDITYKEVTEKLSKEKLSQSVENLDFTTSYFYIWFRIENRTNSTQNLYLETARPITNIVRLFPVHNRTTFGRAEIASGDGIPFSEKAFPSNRSVFPLSIAPNQTVDYFLTLGSDGEIISLPMIFWSQERFVSLQSERQFRQGIFYGIFVFVILIYFTFFVLLRNRLYLIYTIYVFCSGLLQFSLDGYSHQYLFPSGGYFTQHIVLFVAGFTVFFAYTYASKYLQLSGRLRKTSRILAGIVLLFTFASLIPGTVYELCYPLINGSSLISLVFILVAAIRIRRTQQNVSRLFLFGLVSLMMCG